MDPTLDCIENVQPLVDFYADKLSFHDSEVLRIELRRGIPGSGSAYLDLDLHMFAVEALSKKDNRFLFGRHAVVSFRFEGIQDLEIEGFNHQNAIMELAMDRIEPPENGACFRVSMPEAFGVSASFTCFKCLLLGIQPVKPKDPIQGN